MVSGVSCPLSCCGLGSLSSTSGLSHRGFSLLTNVLTLSHFGQKCLLNALNVNVNLTCAGCVFRTVSVWVQFTLGSSVV